MRTCPQCKGATTVSVEFTEHGRAGSRTFQLKCPTCAGRGTLSAAAYAAYQAEQAAWCQCDQQADVVYHDNGQCPNQIHPRKHHYDCPRCGGVIQVG